MLRLSGFLFGVRCIHSLLTEGVHWSTAMSLTFRRAIRANLTKGERNAPKKRADDIFDSYSR